MDQSIEYIDIRGKNDGACLEGPGTLFVQQPYDVDDWQLGPAKAGDVGMDLPVRITGMQGTEHEPELHPPFPGLVNYKEGWIDIPAGSYAKIPSALHVKMPDDSWLMVRPRSSTGFKLHLDTFEGTVDPGYTGILIALVYNRYTFLQRIICWLASIIYQFASWISPEGAAELAPYLRYGAMRIKDGDRLIQIVLVPKYLLKRIVCVDKLPETERGPSGFGSSGGLATQPKDA